MSKDKKRWGLNTKLSHKPYKFDLEVKGQRRIRIMKVPNTSSHGDRTMCQIWYANVKANRSYRSNMKTWQKLINLSLRSKVNMESGSWMYMSHLHMVIGPCAEYGKLNSNGPDTKTCQKPYKFDLEARSNLDYECTWHIIQWYTHVPNMVSHCQTKKKLWARLESAQTERQTYSDSFKPP